MKRLSIALLLGITFLMFIPNASAQSPGCAPYGSGGTAGPSVSWFDYIANGWPDGTTNCWSPNNVVANIEMPCGFFGEKWSDFEFNYGGEIDQQFDIPATSPHTSFTYYGFSYLFNFENPGHEYPWDL